MTALLAALLLSAGAATDAAPTPAPPPPKAKPKLAVFDLQPLQGVTPALAQSVSAVLANEVRSQATGASVISADEIRTLLNAERLRQQVGCSSDTGCLAEIGGALGAAQVLNGQLSKLGSVYVLTLKLLDTRKAQALRSVTENIQSEDQAELISGVKRAVARMFPPTDGQEMSEDLFAESPEPTPSGKSHTLSWVLGGVAVVGAGLAVAGLIDVLAYNGNVNTWNQAYQNMKPLGTTGANIASQRSQANAFQIAGFVGLGVAVLAAGGAVIAW